jgi:cell wall-associated NlpC family hydrolase
MSSPSFTGEVWRRNRLVATDFRRKFANRGAHRHTVRMRRGLVLLVLGVLGAVIGVASARANGVGTTGTTTTTTTATTTTSTPSYAPLATSVLPASCVGAGAAAVVPPSHSAVAVGTPASDLGPSGYPASASVVAFASSSVSGSACKSARVTLTSVSLFQGAVTATSVEATGGTGTVAGLEIGGTAVSAAPGQILAVGDWGQLTVGEKFGRVSAPLVLTLLQAHGSLGAGTRIAVAFSAAAAPPAVAPKEKRQSTGSAQPTLQVSQHYAKGSSTGETQRRQAAKPLDLPTKQPYPFLVDGGGLTPAARHDAIVSIAMHYLGIRYQWGGASPSSGFDCSGLVQYVFAKVGVSLVHYAASQYDYPGAVWVSPKRLQPGDLVFFVGSDGTRKAPGHVGIYVDDGYFIDAPHTGSFVRIDSLTDPKFADQYIAAKRIVGASLRARHLFHATDQNASSTTFPVGFPTPTALEPLGESLPVASTVPAASRGYWIWTGAGLGGLLLVLVLVLGSGAFVLRRRRAPDATVS